MSPETPTQSKPVSRAEFYHHVRGRIDYEENLLYHWVFWLVFSQSFLFSAFAILLNAPKEPKDAVSSDLQACLLWIIPYVALISSMVIYVSVLSALFYMANLRSSFETYPKDDTVNHFPPIQATTLSRLLGELTPITVPLFYIGTWVFILIRLVSGARS